MAHSLGVCYRLRDVPGTRNRAGFQDLNLARGKRALIAVAEAVSFG